MIKTTVFFKSHIKYWGFSKFFKEYSSAPRLKSDTATEHTKFELEERKMKKLGKRILSMVLVALMVVGVAGAGAVEAGAVTTSTSSTATTEVSGIYTYEAITTVTTTTYSQNDWEAWVGGLLLVAGIFTAALIPKITEPSHSYAYTATITEGTGASGEITIPKSFDKFTVKGIGSSAFSGCTGLTGVTVPSSVTYIGAGAFENCSNLRSITLGNSVETLGADFLSGTKVSSITVPASVTTSANGGVSPFYGAANLRTVIFESGKIPDKILYECSQITNVTIPAYVTSIGASAFFGCTGLTKVIIPNSVASIGSSAFSDCTGLTIYCPENSYAHKYAVANGIPYSFDGVPVDHAVTLEKNTGSKSADSSTVVVYNGETYAALPTPSRSNYVFDGWYTEADGGVKVKQTDIVNLTENTTLYAHWTIAPPAASGTNITVEYVGSTQISVDSAETLTWSGGNQYVSVDQSGRVTSLKNFTKTGSATITATNSAGSVSFNVNVAPSSTQWFLIVVLFGWIWM
jgi:uncharacterized repeat protein (TIGR02543 family)